ncbi:hypothetical protein C8F04DRAFT_677677 [Mycena alexandri]|uniref:Extracellular membrane protein CFEM domain-containing protein n=1 Tax=Mycena alexandri TaxID=1745969 RepID=A0AAD6X0Y1_9AGAR|nr:hypothetical protein C8F04DRAFT_677677 [Mycena alexandri]
MKLFDLLDLGIPTLAALAPIFLLLSLSQGASALVAPPPRNLNASLIPAACTSSCQPALSVQSTCGSDNLKCLCTNSNGASFAQCLDCVVGTNPDTLAQNAAEGVLSDYTTKCVQNGELLSSLSLSLASPTGTASAIVATTNAAPKLIRTPHLVLSVIAALQLAFGPGRALT